MTDLIDKLDELTRTITDEQLAELDQLYADYVEEGTPESADAIVEKYAALRARLEAAEKVCDIARAFDPTDDCFVVNVRQELEVAANLAKALDAWRHTVSSATCKHDFRPVCRTWEQCTICGERQ